MNNDSKKNESTPKSKVMNDPSYPMSFRRKRMTSIRRELFSTVSLRTQELIKPYFVYQNLTESVPLTSLYLQHKHTLTSLLKAIESNLEIGIINFLIFIVPSEKKEKVFNYDFDTLVISEIKKKFGNQINLFLDLCVCAQTHTGHCGLFKDSQLEVDNHLSVELLTHKSLVYAQAGCDIISPSDMMDDRILSIRNILDRHHFESTMIMSYSSKMASNFYGPFRDSYDSTPQFGDRKSYQIDPRNLNDMIECSLRDKEQGADILMVKPALLYLDIISHLKNHPDLKFSTLSAYQVSGEYQSLHLLAKEGLIDFNAGLLESLYAIKRSGADLIITYGADLIASILK